VLRLVLVLQLVPILLEAALVQLLELGLPAWLLLAPLGIGLHQSACMVAALFGH
jgi:hypothetical protein